MWTDGEDAKGRLMVRRNPRIVSQVLAGEQGAVLLHMDTSAYHGLNEVGAGIWELIVGPTDVDGICRHLDERYPDAPASLADEVHAFLRQLAERDLVSLAPVDAPPDGAADDGA